MSTAGKPVVWLHGEVNTPPFSYEARLEAGTLLWRLQLGEKLGLAGSGKTGTEFPEPTGLPHSWPMPAVGGRCHELRIPDSDVTWRIVYRLDSDGVIVLEVFAKKTSTTPQQVIDVCKDRLRKYDKAVKEQDS